MDHHDGTQTYGPMQSRSLGTSRRTLAALGVCLAVLLSASAVCAQSIPARVTPIPDSPISGYVNTVLAAHWFEQRGNGAANVAVNYDFVNNTFQDSPALRVQGKPFSVAFWYRSTQNVPYGLLWDNGDGAGGGYVVGLSYGYISVTELNDTAGCTFLWNNCA